MSDDENPTVSPRDHAGPDRYGETLLYDFAKFLTMASLLVLGGMLTLSGAARAGDVPLFNIIFIAAAIAFAGVFAFTTANSIVDARIRGKDPSPHVPRMFKIATALIGLGIGGFLMMWLDTLN